jgi:hypothetical protein
LQKSIGAILATQFKIGVFAKADKGPPFGNFWRDWDHPLAEQAARFHETRSYSSSFPRQIALHD